MQRFYSDESGTSYIDVYCKWNVPMSLRLILSLGSFLLISYALLRCGFDQNQAVLAEHNTTKKLIEHGRSFQQGVDDRVQEAADELESFDIADSNLLECIKINLQWFSTSARPAIPSELENLDCGNRKISSLQGLENLVSLREVNLSENPLEDLAPMKELSEVKDLNISGTGLESIWEITHLGIEKLDVSWLPLRNPNEIFQLSELKELNFAFARNASCIAIDDFFKRMEPDKFYVEKPSSCTDVNGNTVMEGFSGG